MTHSVKSDRRRKRRPYIMAVVLGTALSAAGPAQTLPVASNQADPSTIADISRYCTACWRNARLNPDSWADCTQEVFTRLLERLSPEDWSLALKGDGDERCEFFRAIDAVKKRSQRTRRPVTSLVEAIADHRDARERRLADDREIVRNLSKGVLSARQREILDLGFEGWSAQEIAEKLNVSSARISD